MTFAIVTDSAADLDSKFILKENIRIVPTLLIFGKVAYYDGELSQNEVLDRIMSGEYATTSQSSPADFEKIYSQAVNDYRSKEILAIHISSKLSGFVTVKPIL